MQRTTIKPRLGFRSQGFTLIELLVVIVIVAILFSFATLSIRSVEPEELIETEAQRLDRLIQLVLEESILRGQDYGIDVFVDGYRFLRRENQQWVEISNDKLLRARTLPPDMELELTLEDTEVQTNSKLTDFSLNSTVDKFANEDNKTDGESGTKKITPQIFLLSSGEISPEFTIRVFFPNVETSYLVTGSFDGQHKVSISDL